MDMRNWTLQGGDNTVHTFLYPIVRLRIKATEFSFSHGETLREHQPGTGTCNEQFVLNMKRIASKSVSRKGATCQSITQNLSFDISGYPDTELVLFPNLQICIQNKNTVLNFIYVCATGMMISNNNILGTPGMCAIF